MKPYEPTRIIKSDSKHERLSLDEILRRKAEKQKPDNRQVTKRSDIGYFVKIFIIVLIILGSFIFLSVNLEYSSNPNSAFSIATDSYIQDVIAVFTGESKPGYSPTQNIIVKPISTAQIHSSPAVSPLPTPQILPLPKMPTISSNPIIVGSLISFKLDDEDYNEVEVIEIQSDYIRVLGNNVQVIPICKLPEEIQERLRNAPITSPPTRQVTVVSHFAPQPPAVTPTLTTQESYATLEKQRIDERIKQLKDEYKRLQDEENEFAKDSMMNLATNQYPNSYLYYQQNAHNYQTDRTKQIENYRKRRQQIEDQIKELQVKLANLPTR